MLKKKTTQITHCIELRGSQVNASKSCSTRNRAAYVEKVTSGINSSSLDTIQVGDGDGVNQSKGVDVDDFQFTISAQLVAKN